MKRIKALLKLARIDHGIMVLLAILVAAWVSLNGDFERFAISFPIIIMGGLSGFFVEVATFIFNDYFNIEEDRINAPYRPLVIGLLSLREAFAAGVMSSLLALLLSFSLAIRWMAWTQALVILVALTLGILYDVGLKKVFILNNLIVSSLTALPFIYGALLIPYTVPCTKIWLFFLIAFLAAFGREVTKGICDMRGDLKVNIRTFATLYGESLASKVASLFYLVAVVLTSVLLVIANPKEPFSWLFYPLILLTDIIFAYSVYLLISNEPQRIAEKVRRITLIGMISGIISFATAV